MATKVNGSPPTKEKRGTSPSQKSPIQRGQSPITPKAQTCPSPAKRSNTISPSTRNVPNYLKPTQSSGLESSTTNGVKKHTPNETTIKPNVSRRKSLEKPLPPPSHVPKTRVSAISKNHLPSSPSSARVSASSSSSTKPLMGRLGKARSFSAEKENKDHHHHHHHVKKVENEGKELCATKETINDIVENDNIALIDDTPQIEAIVEKVEDLDQVNDEDQKDKDDIEREVIVLQDNNNIVVDPEIEVEDVKIDESSITPKDISYSLDSEENITLDEISMDELEPDMEELSVPNQEMGNAIEEKMEVEVEEEEEGKTEPAIADQEKEDEVEIKEPESVKDDDQKEENKKNGGENGEVKKVEVVKGKREISVVSNDAIEETATKLREQRVNKVKALAGAFETVISNQ